ncbi:MAG: class I tRNA ligase family protein [Candidatus Pacebacteria bacterium]|nr:class I tRNA ligase family protein [Candidatus Paceibacterota bacterium]
MPKNKFYITTSIAYTNASPHIGFALELIQADTIARYQRFSGKDVFFLTGTDEHGQKVVKAAENAKKKLEEFTDEISSQFKKLKDVLNLSNDDFIRTTDKTRHWPVVQDIWLKLRENGDIYKKKYQGLYCVGCEAFITKKDLIEGKCKIHQKEPEMIEEENYFFKLSKYSEEIEEKIEKNEVKITPAERKNEILSFIRQGLEDVSFSRPRKDLKWGIPVPDDDSQTIYVWADALANYLSALGYPNGEKFKDYWPPDIQFIGKDILRFHAVIWLGILLSLKLELPKNIFIHGYLTSGGQKMSKSLGNVVDPFELVKKYGTDSVRYFLLREIPSAEDGDFSYEKFEERYNADLAKGLGNLTARVLTLAKNIKPVKEKFEKETEKVKNNLKKSLEVPKFNEALVSIWGLIGACDRYIEEERPWEVKENQKEVIGNLLFALNEIAGLIRPFLPETSEKILKQIKIQKSEPLFPRL